MTREVAGWDRGGDTAVTPHLLGSMTTRVSECGLRGVSETGCCAVSVMGLFFSTKEKTKEQTTGLQLRD